jgi:hypothetical protein
LNIGEIRETKGQKKKEKRKKKPPPPPQKQINK